MNSLNAMKTGALWGCCPGAILWLCSISSTTFSPDGLVLLAELTLLSSLCGGVLGLFFVIANKTLEFIIWALDFTFGGILSILVASTDSMIGLSSSISVFIAPILLVIWLYFRDRLPEWADRAFGHAIVIFLTSIMIHFLSFVFEQIAGYPLPVIIV